MIADCVRAYRAGYSSEEQIRYQERVDYRVRWPTRISGCMIPLHLLVDLLSHSYSNTHHQKGVAVCCVALTKGCITEAIRTRSKQCGEARTFLFAAEMIGLLDEHAGRDSAPSFLHIPNTTGFSARSHAATMHHAMELDCPSLPATAA